MQASYYMGGVGERGGRGGGGGGLPRVSFRMPESTYFSRPRYRPEPWRMRPVLPPLEEYGEVEAFLDRAPLVADAIVVLWAEHMSGSPERMDADALKMRRWMRARTLDDLNPQECAALREFFEGMNGRDLILFRRSCGASVYEIARVMHLIDCQAHWAVGWMRQYLYEDWDRDWWKEEG